MNNFVEFMKSRRKVTLILVLLNIVIFAVLEVLGDTYSAEFMVRHGAMYTPMVRNGEYWRLLSAMFLHFGFEHLAYNMFSLFFLGDILETIVGPIRFLAIYLAGGLGGNVLSYVMSIERGTYKVSAGASGAIFAVMGAFFYIVIRNRKNFGRDGMRRLGMMVVLMIMQGIVDRGVDQSAHMGGMAAGFLLGIALYHPRRSEMKQAW
jgi:rhomboid protease GluP